MTGRGGGAGRVLGTAASGAAARGLRGGVLALGLAGVLVLTGCGAATAPPGSPAPVEWPVAELSVLVPASGSGTPPSEAELQDAAFIAEQDGLDVDDVVATLQHQDDFGVFAERVRGALPDTWSSTAFAGPEGEPAWVAFTGEVPAEAVELAQGLPLDVELRGGAALSDAERETAMRAGTDAFAAVVGRGSSWSAGLDAPTAAFTFDYVPGGAQEPDEETSAAVVAAARAAIGRDAPFTVELVPNTTDPTTEVPAVWFLPAGFVADPAATSVEVLVDEQNCTGGQGAEGNTAEPEVEITDTEVRIGISTFIRLGAQTCPGHPLAPLVVDLGGPLGDRVLVDVHGSIDDENAPQGPDVVVPPPVPATAG